MEEQIVYLDPAKGAGRRQYPLHPQAVPRAITQGLDSLSGAYLEPVEVEELTGDKATRIASHRASIVMLPLSL